VKSVCPENDHRVFRCHECVDKRVFADRHDSSVYAGGVQDIFGQERPRSPSNV
jgi:hypothetical protein